MVKIEDINKWEKMETSQLRMFCIALDTENNILRAQLDSTRRERNALLRKGADINLDDSPRTTVQNSLPPIPRPNLPRDIPRG